MKTNLKYSVLTALNLAAALFALAALPTFAAGPYYWDNNTTTAGFGTAGGTWGTSAFWNTDSTGGSGGAFSTSTGTGDSVNFGTASAGLAAGTVALTGTSQGFLNMTFGSASGAIVVNAASTSLNILGSTITVNNSSDTIGSGAKLIGSGGLTISGSGTLTLSGGNTYTGGTIINSGATLKLGNGTALGAASGAVTVNSGGCLNLGGVNLANANALTLNGTGVTSLGALTTSGGQPAQYIGLVMLGSASSIIAGTGDIVLNNTGTITGAGLGLTVGGAKNTYIFSILGTTTGTLTKQDAGTLTLTNVNTYSGNTTINNGKLVGVTGGSCASSAVTVQSSGASTAASLGVYYTGANAQWTCSSLTTSAGVSGGAAPNLAFGFSITPSAGTAPLNVSGNVSFDASTTITVDPANLVSGQSYPLLVASGTVPSTTPTVTIGRGLTGTVAWGGTGNKTLTLTVAGTSVEPLKWQPSSATWSPGDATSNWKDAGGTAASYTEGVIGDQVLFDDTPGAATTVTLNTDAKPGSITFNNSTYNYTLSGNGGLIGSATLTKTGTGTVTINTPVSSYSGGTVIKNGTVILKNAANPNALGSGTITLGDAAGGPVTLLGSWQAYANPINLAANAVGPISLGSSGEFLGENGSWKGAINLNGNNLNLTRPALVLTAVYQIQSAISGTGSLTISNASTGTSASGITFASGGPISISGNITNASSGASGATTTINVGVGSGVTNIVQNSASLPLTVSGALTVNPATTLVNASGAGALLTLSGGATGTGGLTLNNNSSTADAITVMTGAINPTGGVTNSGSGSGEVLISSSLGANVTAVVQNSSSSALKLQGVNTFSGDTIVSAGSLILDTTCTIASTANLVVGGGGTLDVSTENTALALGNTQKLKVSATGTSSTATINMAASKGLTLNATAGKGVEFTAYNGGATAPLTLSGSGGSLALNSAPVTLSSASGLAAGPYTLISHGGSATVTGSPGTFSPGVGALATGATGALSVNGSGDLILTLSYTVTLTNNDASGTTSTISVANGSTYGTLPTPTRTGYTFNGWFTASSGGTQVTSGTTVSLTAPQTLYAQWTLSAVPPTKLVITAVPSGTTPAGNTFSVTVTAEDGSGVAQAVTSDTGISLALASGSGTLGGTTTGTIANGGSAVTISGLTYTKAEAITLTASRTSGMSLTTSVASSSFTIVPNMTTVPASSTVVASPASLAADGSSASTVTATLQDAYGNLLVGSNVTWTVSGSANNVSPASSGTTSGSGVVAFTVKSVKPETKTVTVSVGATVVTNSLTINFTNSATGNNFVWDPSHNGSGSDAAGTWDTSTANWASGSADFAWPNNGSDNATFGSGAALGANYTVNLGAGISVGNLTNNTSGANQYTIGTVAQTLTLAGTTPTVSVAGTMQINSLVAGTAGLTKADSGTLILGTNNSFTGGLTIKNGTVATRNTSNKNLGGSGTGAVTLGDSAGGPASLLLSWQAWNNPITLGTGAVGPLTLGDTMEYTTGGNPLVSGGINLNGNNLNVYNAPGRANGSIVIQTAPITGSAGSSLTLSNANNNGSGSISIPANLGFTGAITNVGAGTNATLISGNIGSTVTAVVQNSATAGLTLSGSNTFSSGLYINAGTVTAGANTNALGGASGNGDGSVYLGDTSGNANATLLGSFITGTAPYPNPITIQSGSSGTLTIGVSGATTSTKFTGAITQNKAFSLLSGSTSGNLNLSGQITGNSQITTDGGGTSYVTLTADNHSSWTGPLVVNSGTFKPGSANCLGSGNTVQINPGATFDLQNATVTIAGLNDNGSSGGTVVNAGSGATLSTLTFGGSGSYSFAGTIAPATTSKIALTMAGSGTQMLGGINTYSGATTISSGTLALGSGGSIANTPNISIAAGATFDVSAAGITLSGSSPQQTLAGGSTNGTATINAPSQTVTLSSSVLLSFKAGGGVSSTVGKISVAGSSANLTLNNSAVTVNVTGSALAAGTYRLLDCAGTLTGTANSTPTITGTALASGYSATVSTTPGAGGHVDLIVNATPSFSGLTASPSIAYGATSVALSGTVSSATGPTTVYAASGDTVTATIHGHAVSGTVSGSAGAFTITYNDASLATLGVGSSPYTITYSYAGNAAVNLNAAANNTGTSLMVGKATPTATLAVNNSPATYNGSAQSATVVINSSSVPGTVGNVKYDGSATAPVAAGTYTVTADFIPNDAADYNTLTGLSAGNFAINPAATTITLSGTTFTYNGSVQSPSISISGSTGARSTNYIGTSYSGANAPTNAGSYTLIVSVLGDGNFFGATNSLPFTINQASISVGASSTNNPCGYHDAVAFLATLPADATGSVVFSSTNGPISTNNVSSGTVTSLSITNLPRGTNVITVAYLGDGNYLGSSTNLEQIVTNHPPIAGMMTVTRTAGLALIIKLSDIATNWSDADGDSVKLTDVTMQSTNGINLFPLNWSTNLDGSIVTTNGYAYIGYTNSPNVADQISYSISDGQDGTNLGYISIVIQGSVTGTNSITGHDFSSPYSNTVTAYGIPYFYYTLERSTNLTSPVWVDVSTNQAAGNGVINAVDTFWDLGGVKPSPSAFYQLKWQP